MRASFAVLALLLVAGCADVPGEGNVPAVPDFRAQEVRADGPPVLLTSKGLGGLEAIAAGELVRQGPCLYLGWGADPQLILWGDGVSIVTEKDGGWAVQLPSGERAREGDRVQGAGGGVPTSQPIQAFANEPVPEECASGGAMQVHSVESVEPARVPEGRPPPPPPAPAPPSIVAQLLDGSVEPQGSATSVSGFTDPRAALFAHMIAERQASGPPGEAALCLRAADDALLNQLAGKIANVHPARDCRWNDGRVVLRADDSPAIFVAVSMDCDGKRQCVAEGSTVSANMGGEGRGYFLEPIADGWSILRAGIEWMS